MNSRIVTFGEIMLRLNPEGYLRLTQAEKLEASYAGGEANVAVSLANYGMDVAFVSKVPMNEIGQSAINAMRRFGVDTQFVLRGGDRLGVYYVEKGASQRASRVIYDRARSAVACSKVEEYDWDTIMDGAGWFHWTGITPALGGDLPEICLAACRAAQEHGVKISCDLNYREKLWTRKKACEVMSKLMRYVDICIANEEDVKDIFGIEAENTDIMAGKLNYEGYTSIAKQICERFGCETTAITLRSSLSATDNDWAALLFTGGKAYFSPTYRIHIVDRIGGGDSFGGGLIYALMTGKDPQAAVEFAVAASCLKHTIEHDFNLVSVAEVESLCGGNTTGRVQR